MWVLQELNRNKFREVQDTRFLQQCWWRINSSWMLCCDTGWSGPSVL